MITDGVIPAGLHGERLDRVVAMIAGCSRAEATRWIADGRVEVDGVVVDQRSHRLAENDRVTIDAPEAIIPELGGDDTVTFEIVHVDDDVIVIDKPAGLVVHPGPGHPDGTLVNGLLARFPEISSVGEAGRPGIVHRLDRGTSGLLVVARTPRAYEQLVADFASHDVERTYVAVVLGHPEPGRGLVDAPIGRSARFATRMTVTAGGKPARTHYEVLERLDGPIACALVRCDLETGRTHQIRVHLAAISHPVLGDGTYGGARPEVPMSRPFLHARTIGFTHPVTAEPLRFESSLPMDLEQTMAVLSPARAPHRD